MSQVDFPTRITLQARHLARFEIGNEMEFDSVNASVMPGLVKKSLAEGWAAAKRHRVAGAVLWMFGCAIVAGYYLVPAFHDALEQIGDWKRQSGLLFAALSTAVFAGLIPTWVQRRNAKQESGQTTLAGVTAITAFWALKGIEIELLYRFLAWLLGDRTEWMTIATKTAFDQFVYVPTIGVVNVVLFYLWRECQFNVSEFRRRLGRHWYVRRVLPVMISNWIVWIPAVILIYCFPQSLQLPVQNLILCFWVLILSMLTSSNTT